LPIAQCRTIVKVQVCNLRLTDNIEQIGHSDANIEWSWDGDLDRLSNIKTAFEIIGTFSQFSNFILNVSNFRTMV